MLVCLSVSLSVAWLCRLAHKEWWLVILSAQGVCWWPHILHLAWTLPSTVTKKIFPDGMGRSTTLEHDWLLCYAIIHQYLWKIYNFDSLWLVLESITLWFNVFFPPLYIPFRCIKAIHKSNHVKLLFNEKVIRWINRIKVADILNSCHMEDH